VHQFRRPRRASAGRATAGLHGDLPADLPADLHGGLVWADWIATGLAGRAVRALHVVGGAAFDTDRALLAISPDPGRPADPAHCTYVTGDEVRLLADTIGASVLSFGSPPDNPSEAATRVIADGVGLQRPGPTFFSTLRLDPGGYALAQAHAFVAGQGVPSGASEASEKEAAPAPIPRDPSLFAYLQPEYVQASLREPWPDPDQPGQGWLTGRSPARDRSVSAVLGPTLESAPSEEVSQYYATAESVPGWVAASERYIDTNVAHLVETAAPPGDAPDARQAYDQGTAKALGELRDLVERHVMGS
jgi:hypothetical protein